MKLIRLASTVLGFFLFLAAPQHTIAKTYAYFIGSEGGVAKLDTDTNTIASLKLKIPTNVSMDAVLAADTVNNHLFIAHCVRLGPCKVGVYSLKTLDFIKELSLVSSRADIQMLIYPDGSGFLINYLLAGSGDKEGGYTIDLYDAKTLVEKRNLQTFFGMKEVMFSADGKKIYSVIGGDDARADIIDSTTFQVLTSRDLTQIWRKDVFVSDIEDFVNGKIVISEDLKTERSLPDKLDFYVYDIVTGATSPKISTGLQGNLMLHVDGARIILDETQDIRQALGGKSRYIGYRSLGRMHIYDVATGKELRTISFKAQGRGNIRGIRPAGDRLYYESEGLTKDTTNITVIDIKNYQVLTTISLPFKPLTMIFFEQ